VRPRAPRTGAPVLTCADRGNRQHALLHLSRMHFQREEYTEARRVRPSSATGAALTARQLLEEAQALCRVKNDRATLMHCMACVGTYTRGGC
jgi:hypothetical protein